MSPTDTPALHRELHLTAEHLRALAASTSVVLWVTGENGSVEMLNPSWGAFTGQSPEQYRGWGWLEAIHPADRDRVRQLWADSVAARSSVHLGYRLRRHDGAYRLVNAEATLVQSATHAEWVGYCHDITDVMQTESALRASEERLRFLDQLAQGTRALTDPTHIMAETARLLGEHLRVTRCAYADVEADNDTFTIRSDWSAPGVSTSAGVYSLELFGPHAAHSMRTGEHLVVNDVDAELGEEGGGRMFNAIGIKAIICAALVKEGRLVAMMAVHQSTPRAWQREEIALVAEVVDRCWAHVERVRYAAMLEEQDRRKNEFLATLAHELRNPLAPMRYASAILRAAPAGGARALQAQEIVERQLGVMARLVDDLLDLSRINRGLIELQREYLSLATLVGEAVDTLRGVIASAGHELEVRLPPGELVVHVDRTRMIQVIGNLLSNAAKYTPDGGRIAVAAWQQGDRVLMEVRDNGVGIPAAEQGRLFHMFSQLPHTAGRAQGGLGIGLALTRTLVRLHGGEIRVASEGLGKGTTFTVELPLAAAPAAAADENSGPELPLHGLRVLVVEDNPDGLRALVSLLEVMGCTVRGAPDADAGLAIARVLKPQVAILDLGLPRKDGLMLARELRAEPTFEGSTLVALTGWGSAADRARTREAGFDHHLTKPVAVDELRRLLDALVARQGPVDAVEQGKLH